MSLFSGAKWRATILTLGRGWRLAVTLTLAYLAIALVMSYPLITHFRSFAMAGLEDGAMSVWNLWWMKYSLINLGESPMFTKYLFAPDGASMAFHSLPKLLGLLSIPLQYFLGMTAAYNVIFLLTFVLTALTTYLLAHHLLGERLPAFVAGSFFAFCPFRWDQQGHLQLLSTMLIPVYILLVIRGREAIEKGGRRPWVYFSLAGFSLAALAYDTEYYAVFLVIFSAIYFVFNYAPSLSRIDLVRWGKLLAGLLLAGIVFAILFLPMLLAARRELSVNGNYVTFPGNWAGLYARDLLSFFLPPEQSRHLARFASAGQRTDVDVVYLGWVAIALALAGVWFSRRRRELWLFLVTAVSFALLALGPQIKVGERIISSHGPYLLLTKIPVINAVRVPSRLTVMTALALAILAGYGASALFRFLKARSLPALAIPTATALILFFMFIEYRPYFDMTSTRTPAVYSEIRASGAGGTLITIPLGWEGGAHRTGIERTFTQLFQIEHETPMLGGMLARVPTEQLFEGVYSPVIDFLADPVRLEPSDLDRDAGAIERFRQRYGVSFIVAHKQPPEVYYNGGFIRFNPNLTPEALERIDRYLTQDLGMEKFSEDEEVVAYRWRR